MKIKVLVALVVLSCGLSLHAQYSKVVPLTPDETKELSSIQAEREASIKRYHAEQDALDKRSMSIQLTIENKYVVDHSAHSKGRLQSGWKTSSFTYSEDYKFIISNQWGASDEGISINQAPYYYSSPFCITTEQVPPGTIIGGTTLNNGNIIVAPAAGAITY